MKKVLRVFGCIILCVVWIIGLVGICVNIKPDKTTYSLTLVDEVKDRYDNIIQQTYYNSVSDDYLVKEFSHTLQNNKWVCVDQRITVIPFSAQEEPTNPYALKIFYDKDFTNEPIVIMDNEDIKISIVKNLATDSWYYFGYELKIVNKSNKVLSVLIDDASIMDIQCKPLFNIEHIDAGQTAYFTMAWQKEELERCHIPCIDNIQFMVRVFTNESYNYNKPAMYGNKVLMKFGGN